jgi:pimeloyl-ACP methyl ester carboxylesterase
MRTAAGLALCALLATSCIPLSQEPKLRPLYGAGTSVDAMLAGGDGLPVHYRLAGQGEPTIVLLHGWSLDLNTWSAEMDRLASHHQVLAIDLAGHGSSAHDRPHWTVEGLAADVVAAVTTLDLHHLVLVGHSMSGDVALEVSRQIPGRIVGVIGVDSPLDIGHPTPVALREELLDGLSKDFPRAARALADRLLGSAAPPEVRAQIETSYAGAPPESAVAILRAVFDYDPVPALAGLRAPLRLIVTTDKPDLDAIRRLHADSAVIDLTGKGLGNFPMLERPALFDPALDSVLATMPSPRPSGPGKP